MWNKKISMLACVGVALTITTSVILSTVVLTKQATERETKPDGRENYEHVSISYLLDKKEIKTKCLSYIDETELYAIDSKKFKKNVDVILHKGLQKISRFTNNINNYTIEVSYKLDSEKTILVDVVWYIYNNNPHKYYDQFSIDLA